MKITLIASILVSNLIFCQKEIDTIYIEDVNKIVDQEGDLSIYIKTSDGKTHLAIYDSGFKVGNVLCYIDNVQNEMISPQEYESSIYFQLRGTDFDASIFDCTEVHCVKVKKSPFNKFKYKVITDSSVSYYVNFPPKIGEEVFCITEDGRIVKSIRKVKL
jgi:hypothetical protein